MLHVTFAQSPIKLACSDTGSTNLLIRQSDASGVIPAPHLQPISVILPNGTGIYASSCGHVHFPNLPIPIFAHIFPDIILHTSVLSVSELRNVGCLATFTATIFQVTYNELLVLHGSKLPTDKLQSVQLSTTDITTSTLQCNATRIHSDADLSYFSTHLLAVLRIPYLSVQFVKVIKTPGLISHRQLFQPIHLILSQLLRVP